MVVCDRCGTSEEDALGWSLESTPRGVRRLCGACTRDHVRDIEAKLDEEWWS